MELPDNISKWKSEWFYIGNQKPKLPQRTGHGPVKVPEWDLQVTSRGQEEINILLTNLEGLKSAGLTGDAFVGIEDGCELPLGALLRIPVGHFAPDLPVVYACHYFFPPFFGLEAMMNFPAR